MVDLHVVWFFFFLTFGAQNKNVVVGGCGNLHSSVLSMNRFSYFEWNLEFSLILSNRY